MLKHSVKLRHYMLFGDVAARHRVAFAVCCVAHNTRNSVMTCCHITK